jgi:hypothetical protein
MPISIKYSNIEKYKKNLATKKKDFKKQLKEVEKKYPLVALAFSLQNATIAELSISRNIGIDPKVEDIVTTLTGTESWDTDAIEKTGIKLNNCFRNFDRDLARSRDSSDVKGSIDKLTQCIRSAHRP